MENVVKVQTVGEFLEKLIWSQDLGCLEQVLVKVVYYQDCAQEARRKHIENYCKGVDSEEYYEAYESADESWNEKWDDLYYQKIVFDILEEDGLYALKKLKCRYTDKNGADKYDFVLNMDIEHKDRYGSKYTFDTTVSYVGADVMEIVFEIGTTFKESDIREAFDGTTIDYKKLKGWL